MSEKYYTVEQISELLGMHPKTVQRYIREGRLRAVKIGKGWRVTGHDLSTFTESAGVKSGTTEEGCAGGGEHAAAAPEGATASAVVDIPADKNEAIRILNALTAALNSKPPEYGRSSMHAQHIGEEAKVRVTLWGSVRFMAAMMGAIAVLTDNYLEE
jgi:excisionase family DNA binding protein